MWRYHLVPLADKLALMYNEPFGSHGQSPEPSVWNPDCLFLFLRLTSVDCSLKEDTLSIDHVIHSRYML